MGADKPLSAQFILASGQCAFQGVKQGDIQFIGFVITFPRPAIGDPTPKVLHQVHHLLALFIAEQAIQRAQADAIVGGNKIQIGGAITRRWHAHHPGLQMAAVATEQGVNQQRRQGEVIDDMGFVGIAEVGEVLPVGHIVLTDDDRFR